MSETAPEDRGAPSSVLRPRLAWAAPDGVPDLDALGLRAAKEAAFAWQSHRGYAEWHEFVWVMENPDVSDWVPEIHGLFGICGELVLTCIEAEAEVALARNALSDGQSPAMTAALWRTERFFVEGQANNLVIFGHAVANLTLRTLALIPSFAVSSIRDLRAAAFVPKSEDRYAWASLSPKTASEIKSAAVTLSPSARAVSDALHDLVDGAWGELWELRGGQYHRWRGESPGVAGINFRNETLATRLRNRQVIGFGGDPTVYVEGEGVMRDLAACVRQVVDQVSAWMPHFLELWCRAFADARPSLQGPTVAD